MAPAVEGLAARVHREIWERDLTGASWLRRNAIMAARVVNLAFRGWNRHEIMTRAAALTYVTIFSLVPTIAVGFAMFKAFGGLDQAREVLLPKLLEYIAVGSQEEVRARIEEFINNIHGGAVGGAGTVTLVLSVASLLGGMEQAFNSIWEVSRSRTFFQRVTIYWTVVTVTPTLLLAGLALPAALRHLGPIEWVVGWTGGEALLFQVLLPFVFVVAGFTLMYLFVPNTHVSVRAALVGALVAGALWTAAVYGYAAYASRAVGYSSVYGSLAALPIFLLWIYVTWLIVLLGAEIAFAAQNVPTTPIVPETKPVSQFALEVLALRIVAIVSRRFLAGEPAATTADLAQETAAPPMRVQETVERLRAARLLMCTADDARLLPAQDPARTSPADVIQALRGHGDGDLWGRKDEDTAALERRQAAAEAAASAAWGGVSVADVALGRGQKTT